ncbi:hypothetical protein Lfu02_74880 [Longispora fulva]|nr:hypothetical protein Lfu02_74880 [Longispora fulva]
MDIGILGPLMVSRGDSEVRITAPKPRKVLALLLVQANRVVPVSSLVKELWEDSPPLSSATTLQTYILQIRRVLRESLGVDADEVAGNVLVTRNGGYQFRVDRGSLDLHEFERLSVEGRQRLATGDAGAASLALRDALSLWRGPALVDVQAGPLLEVEILRLHEGRLTALQQRIEADLRLGRHLEILSELTALTAEYPLHENLNAQYMLALHRSGRRTEALGVFQRLRASLVQDLGLEPSQQIQRLQHAMLSSDPALEERSHPGQMVLDRFLQEQSSAAVPRPRDRRTVPEQHVSVEPETPQPTRRIVPSELGRWRILPT